MTRFTILPDLKVRDPADGEMVPLIGAPAAQFTAGFEGRGRLVRLAVAAIEDLRANLPKDAFVEPMGVFIATTAPEWPAEDAGAGPPDADQDDDDDDGEEAAMQAIAADEGPEPSSEPGEPPPAPPTPDEWAHGTATVIATLAALPGAREKHRVYLHDRGGTLAALAAAAAELREGSIATALVLAVDSSFDHGRLSRWLTERRVKTPEQPVGFIPGEAACALLLTSRAHSVGHACLILHGPFIEREALRDVPSPSGAAIESMMSAAAAVARQPVGTLYVDANGETLPADDFGHALARLPLGSPLREARYLVPAASFGETGAAGPLLAVLLASRGFARGHEPSDAVMVLASLDRGVRAALLVERLSPSPRGR